MAQSEIDALLARMRGCDTPTICNAIEVAQGQRGFSGFTHRTIAWAGGDNDRIVGFARTASIAGNAPPKDPPEVIRARRMEYFEHMSSGLRPGVAVIEDMDGDAALGAWWGEVHAQVHSRVFGLCGAVTNGVLRDWEGSGRTGGADPFQKRVRARCLRSGRLTQLRSVWLFRPKPLPAGSRHSQSGGHPEIRHLCLRPRLRPWLR